MCVGVKKKCCPCNFSYFIPGFLFRAKAKNCVSRCIRSLFQRLVMWAHLCRWFYNSSSETLCITHSDLSQLVLYFFIAVNIERLDIWLQTSDCEIDWLKTKAFSPKMNCYSMCKHTHSSRPPCISHSLYIKQNFKTLGSGMCKNYRTDLIFFRLILCVQSIFRSSQPKSTRFVGGNLWGSLLKDHSYVIRNIVHCCETSKDLIF